MVMLLVVLTAAMVVSAGYSRAAADNLAADLQNDFALQSAYYRGLLVLEVDARESGAVDSLHEPWARPFEMDVGEAQVEVVIEDAERALNLSSLVFTDGSPHPENTEVARRLFSLLNQPHDHVLRIRDYIDTNVVGAFEEGARNDFPYLFPELARIRGISPSDLFEKAGGGTGHSPELPLERFTTIWPREGVEKKPPPPT